MTNEDRPAPAPQGPQSFLAAAAALRTIEQAVTAAEDAGPEEPGAGPAPAPDQALAALLMLREVREHLAAWETGLIETARDAGASWADLARPLGVGSRQAAERRYLRQRPSPGTGTGEQRVKAVRDRRAAERTVTAWAKANTRTLRVLAGQISALPDLPPAARTPLAHLGEALAEADPSRLLAPLAASREHLQARHPELATQVNALIEDIEQLRQESDRRRQAT